MRTPDEPYDLDAEIAKYGGRTSLPVTLIGQHMGAVSRPAADPATSNPAPYDLDAEIAKYGGQRPLRLTSLAATEDPLAAIDRLDPSVRTQVEVFSNILGAVDMVIPRDAPDPRMAGGMSWRQWERYRLDRVFREGRVTTEQARHREELQKKEHSAWLERQRKIQRAWARWMRWRRQSPQMADAYRREHQDADGGDESWLVGFASVRVPRAQIGRQDREKSKKKGVGL